MSIQFKDLLGNEISINSINNVSYNINFSRDVKKVEVRNYKFPGFTPSSLRKTEIIEVELNSGVFIYIIGKQKVFEKFIYELSLSGDKCPPVKLSGKKAVKEDYFLQYVINYVAEKNSIQRTAVMDRIEIKQGFVFIGYKYHILEKDLVNVSEEILEKSFVFDDHFIKLCANFGYCDGKNKSTPKLQKQDFLSDTAQKEDNKINENEIESGVEFIYGSSVDNSYVKIIPDDKRQAFTITPEDIESYELKQYSLYSVFGHPLSVLEVKLRSNREDIDNRFFILEDEKYFEQYIKSLPTGLQGVSLSHLGNIEIDWFIKYSVCYAAKKHSLDEYEIIKKCKFFGDDSYSSIPMGYLYGVNRRNLNLCFIFQDGLEVIKDRIELFSDTRKLTDFLFQKNKDKIVQDINEFFELYGSKLERIIELEKEVFKFTLASDYKQSIEGEKLKKFLDEYKQIEANGELNNPISKELLEKLESIRDDYNVLCNKPHSYQIGVIREKGLLEESAEIIEHTYNNDDVEINRTSSVQNPIYRHNFPHQNNFHQIQNQGTYIGQRNASPERRTSGITHELSLEEYVSSYKIFIDTCSLLKDGIYKFFEEIKPYLTSSGNKIIIPYRCIKELEKHTVNNLKLELNEPAKKILDYLEKLNNEGLIDIRGDKDDNFADNIFLTVFNKYRLKTNLLLITEDYRLASDINALTQQKSVESNYKIKTADLNSFYPLFKQQPRYGKDFGEIKGWTFDD